MNSFGNSSMQGSSVPMNPMMAMIQRQQQEQQQYEALTAGATMGVSIANGGGQNNNNAATVALPSSATSSIPDNNFASYMNNMPFSQDALQQRQIPTTGSLHQRIPQQQYQQLPMNEMSPMYSQARTTYPEMNSIPMQQQQQQQPPPPMMMPQQQQQPMFNVGNLSPSDSPAPNHTQFYSNVDMQPSYYSDPSMVDLQTSYMNMVQPTFMSSAMDNATSSYLPLHQSTPPQTQPMMIPQQQQHQHYPHMSYSPVPQMFMANHNSTAAAAAATTNFGTSDPTTNMPPPSLTTSMKLGYPTDGSNLTSMPVQIPPTILPPTNTTVADSFQPPPRRDSSSRSMASPTTPTHPPPGSSSAPPPPPTPSEAPTTTVPYIPKIRQVETYGGVDLKYFEKFDIRPAIPYWEELGVVDMTALTMSLRSGTKMELTNALNTLTTLTMQPRLLVLAHCEGLLDTLLDHLQKCVFYHDKDASNNDNDLTTLSPTSSSSPPQTYAELFEFSLLEMKSLIPALAPTSSQDWLASRDLLLCLLTVLRNVSFMEENIDYLATHPRLCPLLADMIHLTQQHHQQHLRCMDILEVRKCIMTIYANIAIATPPTHMNAWIYLIHDFMVHGADTYYAMLAMEAWTKCSVHDAHRRTLLATTNTAATINFVPGIWTALLNMLRRQFYLVEMGTMTGMSSGQLGTLELVMMGMYNVVALADLDLCDTLVASEPGVAMTLLRICFTLAEADNHHFRVAAQRAMETVYALVLGGGVKVTQLIQQQHNHPRQRAINTNNNSNGSSSSTKSGFGFSMTSADLDDEEPKYRKQLAYRVQRLLHHTHLQEKLLMVMLKPAADQFILSGLDDLLMLMADMAMDN